jgi:peptidoglycan-N-acetylglucosamine deacetylase
MPVATVSVDLDPVDVHLAGYAHDADLDDKVYEVALPRLLDAFARHGVRATFFLLGRDAERAMRPFETILAAGHEIASHSVNHPPRLASLPGDELRHQLEGSRCALEAGLGVEVTGFRAPDWSIGHRAVRELVAAGYRYDASLMPSPVLTVGRGILAIRARRPREMLGIRPPASFRRLPFNWTVENGSILEFPVAVTRGLRLPVYHTLRYAMGERRFVAALDALSARGESLSYPLHGVDALGTEEDDVDRRLGSHPGMGHPLDRKLELLDETLAAIKDRYEFRTFAQRIRATREEVAPVSST